MLKSTDPNAALQTWPVGKTRCLNIFKYGTNNMGNKRLINGQKFMLS